jgi:hypothetical protein
MGTVASARKPRDPMTDRSLLLRQLPALIPSAGTIDPTIDMSCLSRVPSAPAIRMSARKSMIPKSGYRLSEKTCSGQNEARVHGG